MDKFVIEGNGPLSGEIAAGGAKNAALPILCASLLSNAPLTVTNVPDLWDVGTTGKLLSQMGVKVEQPDVHTRVLDARGITTCVAPYELVRTMRAFCAGAKPPGGPGYGLSALRMVHAALWSLRNGGQPIDPARVEDAP